MSSKLVAVIAMGVLSAPLAAEAASIKKLCKREIECLCDAAVYPSVNEAVCVRRKKALRKVRKVETRICCNVTPGCRPVPGMDQDSLAGLRAVFKLLQLESVIEACSGAYSNPVYCRNQLVGTKLCTLAPGVTTTGTPTTTTTTVPPTTTTLLPTTTTVPVTTSTTSSTTTTTLVSGCFQDWGDGTIRDTCTGLQWEKKDDAGGIHDVDNTYSWTADGSGGTAANGTAYTVFLPTLNGTCDGDESTPCADDSDCTGIGNGLCGHAGYRDWRLPSEAGCNDCFTGQTGWPQYSCPCDPAELESILLEPYPCGTQPCIDSRPPDLVPC